MNTTDDNTSGDTAASRAEAGSTSWEDAVRLQRWATPAHADFYALAGEVVTTLHALDDLTVVLGRQVAGYAAANDERGQVVYDDTREIDPVERLGVAGVALEELRSMVVSAEAWANQFWSAIGHIGVEDPIDQDRVVRNAARDPQASSGEASS